MLTVTLNGEIVETSVRGKVISCKNNTVFVDFSEYANEKKYEGDWSFLKEVNIINCIEEK